MAKRSAPPPEPEPKLDPAMARTRCEPPVGVRVGPTEKKGRGVFATRAITKDELVEAAPVIVMPARDQNLLHASLLNDYVYEWRDSIAVALGYGSLYNHSWDPNLEYRKRHAEALIEYVALRDVAEGEELTINYSSSRPDRGDLWTDLL